MNAGLLWFTVVGWVYGFACLDCGLLLVVRGVCFWIWWKCWFVDMTRGLG